MITGIRIQNFKSIADTELLLGRLTMILGANASGKSNVIEALQLLSWLASGQRLGELPHAMRERTLPIRGFPKDLPTRDEPPSVVFEVEYRGDIPGVGRDRRCRLHLRLSIDKHGARIVDEWLKVDHEGVPLYRTTGPAAPPSHDLQVAYNNFSKGGRKPKITCVDDQAVFTQLTTPARFGERHKKSARAIPQLCRDLTASLRDILFLDPRPSEMRGYAFEDDDDLVSNGANVSAVLFGLAADPEVHNDILDFVAELPESHFQGLAFHTTPRGEVMVALQEGFDSREPVEASLLSDGTLRVLAIAAALYSVPRGATVFVEEIDNGVHPSRARHLLRSIDRVASSRRLRVVISSHNPALQDELPPQALHDAVACYRDGEDGSTRLVRLGDLPRFAELIARGPLGALATERTLERFLPDHADEQPRPPLDLSFLEEAG